MPDTQTWIDALRASHDRLAGLLRPLSASEIEQPAYPSEWSIADTASHIGSQAEILQLFVDAGLTGAEPPGMERFSAVWDRWNALAPADQVSQSIAADEALVTRLEGTTAAERESFSVPFFTGDQDIAGLAAARLGEHAVHTWDIAVALDPTAVVPGDAAALLVDELPVVATRASRPVDGADPVAVATTAPERRFTLTLSPEVTLEVTDQPGPDPLVLTAEAFLRLVYGRLDADHTPADVGDPRLPALREAFPGF